MPQAIAAAAVWVGNAVGTAIGGLLTAGGVAATTALPLAVAAANAAYLVAEIALYTGLQNIVDDISNEKAAPQGHELSLRIASDVAREMVIGVRPLAGSMVARYSYGKDVTQASFVYQLADHPCVELTKVYGDGRLVQSSPLAHGVRTEITAYSYSGGPRVWMTWHDGRPGQTADAQLVLKSPTDPDVVAGAYGAWTSAHVGAGNSYVHVEVHHDDDILTSIPEFLFLIKGARLYDRRKDTTAGGSGSHRLATPSTWEYSTNNAVACDHYLLGYKVENDPLAFGIGLSPVEVPYATFARAADLCDEDVTTGTGGDTFVMKRYECNAIISTAEAFESVLNNFQNQMAARIVDLGGRIGIIGAEEQTATISLSDLDWATDESVRFADKLTFDGLYGAVLGSYPDPANMWQPTPYTRQATEYLALQDGGEAATAQLDLPYETNSRRAIRLAAAWIARESLQPRMVGTFATRSRAWKLEPGDWFNMSSDRWQFSNQKFEVVDIVKHDDFTVTLTGRAIDPNFLAFSTDDDPDLGVPPVLDPYQLLMDAPTFSASASTLVAGGVVEPCIEVTLTSSEALAREIVVEVGKWNGSTIDTPTMVDAYHAGQIVTKIRKGILPSTAYKVRMKKRAGVRESPWSAWSSVVTTGATYSVGSAGIADSIVGQAPAATDSTIQAGATKNTLTFASSAPSSPTNGDIWVDTTTTPYLIKTRVSGAWQISASYGGVFGGTLYETGGGAVATLANFKTISGTSAGFTGQGALATLNLVAQAQLAAGVGANACVDTGFRFDSQYWLLRITDSGLPFTVAFALEGGLRRMHGSIAGTPASGKVAGVAHSIGNLFSQSIAHCLPVNGGDRVEGSAYFASSGAIDMFTQIVEFAANGDYITTTNLAASGAASGGGSLSTYARSGGFVTVGSTTRYVGLGLACSFNGTANPWYKATCPLLRRATTGQTELTPFAPGIEAQLGADVTSGATAAAVAGQGSQATANAQRGSSYSGTPTEGSWWSDTSVNKLKYYTGGTWYPVAVLTVEPQSALYGPTTLTSATYVNMASITMPAEMPSGAKLRFTPGVTEASSASGTTTVSWRIQDTTGGTTVASGTFACNVAGVVSANTSLTSMISQLFTAAGAGPRTYEFQMQKGSQNLTSIDGIFIGERVG